MTVPSLRSAPLDTIDGIPVFVTADRYTRNYDRIARDHLAEGADGNANPFITDLDWSIIEDSTVGVLRAVAEPGQSILDIGVGTGRLLEYFPELDKWGVDISIDYLRLLPAKNIRPFLARSEELPFADASFDLVVSTDVLEHVIDLHATLLEMRRVLKPGGHLVVRVPYRENLAPYLAPGYPYEFVHVRNFDENGLRLLLCRVCGFEPAGEAFAHIMAPLWMRVPQNRIVGGAMARLVRPIVSRSRPIYEWVARTLYRPITITMLVRKPL